MLNFLNRLKSLALWELLKGLKLTGGYLVSKKVTVQYPEEKTLNPLDSEVCTLLDAIQMEKNDVLDANFARQYVPPWQFR